MIKKIYAFLALSLFVFSANAQITLTYATQSVSSDSGYHFAKQLDTSNYINYYPSKVDTFVKRIQNVVRKNQYVYYNYGVANYPFAKNHITSNFTNFAYYNRNDFFVNPSISIPSRAIYTDNLYGLAWAGNLIDSLTINLSNATGSSGDKIFVPYQVVKFKSPQYTIKYPATSGSTPWIRKEKDTFVFNSTINALKLNNQSGTNVISYYSYDAVIGYGKLSVPNGIGASKYEDVLWLVHVDYSFDSITFSTNKTTNDTLHSALGIRKGKNLASATFSDFFYRKGTNIPLLRIDSRLGINQNNQFVRAGILDAIYDSATTQDPTTGLKVAQPSAISGLRLYPNPVQSNSTTIEFLKESNAHYTIQVVNMLGQIVSTSTVGEEFGIIRKELNLPLSASNGIYLYNVISENGEQIASGNFSLQR